MDVDIRLVQRLIAAQFPQWAELAIEPVPSGGTDNAIFRLGEDMSVRLPRVPRATGQVEKEHQWLPRLAPHLPLAIPVPLGKGAPGDGYPWAWSVYPWLDGEHATLERVDDARQLAADLAAFVVALRRIDAQGGPPSGPQNEFRGVPLEMRDVLTREAIASLDGRLDSGAATAAWDAALLVPGWQGPAAWLHGDLQVGNLLAVQGRLVGIIDFGLLGVGDPACDLIVAWSLLPPGARHVFRAASLVDDATWQRGRGWALSVSLIALAAYADSNAFLADISRRAIGAVLADHEAE